jgi:hypothetical protein
MGVDDVQGIKEGKDMLAQGRRVVTERADVGGLGDMPLWCKIESRVERSPQWSCLSVSTMSAGTGLIV